MTTMRVVGECFFWYRLTRVFPEKFHRAVKRLCVCVCVGHITAVWPVPNYTVWMPTKALVCEQLAKHRFLKVNQPRVEPKKPLSGKSNDLTITTPGHTNTGWHQKTRATGCWTRTNIGEHSFGLSCLTPETACHHSFKLILTLQLLKINLDWAF